MTTHIYRDPLAQRSLEVENARDTKEVVWEGTIRNRPGVILDLYLQSALLVALNDWNSGVRLKITICAIMKISRGISIGN